LTSAGRRLTSAGHFAAGAGASSSSAAAALRFLSAAAMAVGSLKWREDSNTLTFTLRPRKNPKLVGHLHMFETYFAALRNRTLEVL
jgi:hypothetical protein